MSQLLPAAGRLAPLLLVLGACANPVDGGSGLDCSTAKGPTTLVVGQHYNNPFASLVVHPTDPNTIYIGSEGNGIFKSTDGGVTWSWQRNGLACLQSSEGRGMFAEIYSMAIDPSNPQTVYAAGSGGPGRMPHGGIYRTTNGGASWTRLLADALPGNGFNLVTVQPTAPHAVFAAIESEPAAGQTGALVRSVTGLSGAHTQPISVSSIKCQFADLQFRGNPANRGYVLCTNILTGGPLYRTNDGGQTFTKASANEDYVSMSAGYTNPDLVYATRRSNGQLYRSTDGGNNFAPVLTTSGGPVLGDIAVTVSPHSDQVVFLSQGLAVVSRTANGFSTAPTVVMEVTGGPSDTNAMTKLVVAPSDPNIVYVSARNMRIYRSTNGGVTFVQVANLVDFINSQP